MPELRGTLETPVSHLTLAAFYVEVPAESPQMWRHLHMYSSMEPPDQGQEVPVPQQAPGPHRVVAAPPSQPLLSALLLNVPCIARSVLFVSGCFRRVRAAVSIRTGPFALLRTIPPMLHLPPQFPAWGCHG